MSVPNPLNTGSTKPLEHFTLPELLGQLDESRGTLGGNLFEFFGFAEQVEEFIRNNRVGAYLKVRAVTELHQHTAALLDQDLTDAEILAKVREMRSVNRTIHWLREAIEAGQAEISDNEAR